LVRFSFVGVCACLATGVTTLTAASRQAGKASHPCALLTQAELEKLLGGKEKFPTPPQEDAGPSGTSDCSFSAATFQVDAISWSALESDAKKNPAFKPLAGVGDTAYVTVNTSEQMVGIYARGGRHAVTVRVEISPAFPTDTTDKARAAAVALAQALLAKAQ